VMYVSMAVCFAYLKLDTAAVSLIGLYTPPAYFDSNLIAY